MKQIFKFCLLSILTIAMASGCKKDPDPDFPVKFDLKLLNNAGHSLNTFKEGDTITLSFEVYNTTNEDVYMDNFQPKLLCSTATDFFKIYRQSTSGDWVNLGKVCTNNMMCTYEGGYILNALEIRKIQFNWPSVYESCATGNNKLTKGNYRTSMNYTFKMGEKYNNQEKNINTTVYFTIY